MGVSQESSPEVAEDSADDGGDRVRRSRWILRSAVFTLLAALAAVLIVGEGDSDDTVALAAGRMSEVSSYRAEMRMKTRAEGEDRDSPGMVMEAIEDLQRQQSRWVLRAPPEVGTETEFLAIDGTRYMRLGADLQALSGVSTPWIAYPRSKSDVSDRPMSAETALDQLRRASGADSDPEPAGEELVRGVATKRYEVALTGKDARDYMDQQGGAPDGLLRSGKLVTLSVWVDDEHLIRRYRSTNTFTLEDPDDPPGEREPVEYEHRVAVDYFDFDVEVPVFTAPPEHETTFFETSEAFNERLQAALTRE